MQVPFQKCADPDTVAHPERVKYPNGLICAGDTGTKYWLLVPDAKCINDLQHAVEILCLFTAERTRAIGAKLKRC